MGKRILHVTGFSRSTRARDLAHAFERYGPLVRCDIPASRRDGGRAFAFIEYEDSRDAADAFDRMHDQYVGDHRVAVQWAKRPPARSWRFENERRGRSGRSRSRSPYRRSRSRSRSPSRTRHRSRHRSHSRQRSYSRDRASRRDDRYGGDRRRGRRSVSRSRSREPSLDRASANGDDAKPHDLSPRRDYSRSRSRSLSRSRSRSPVLPRDEDVDMPPADVAVDAPNGHVDDMDAASPDVADAAGSSELADEVPAHDDRYSE